MMNMRDSWQAEFFEKQASQQRRTTKHDFRRRLYQEKAGKQLASAKMALALIAATLAWSFAGMQLLR